MSEKCKSWKKAFAIIYSGQVFSIIGSSAAQFAIIWWLTAEYESAMVLTVAGVVAFLPNAIVGPFAGVWIDRYNRKTVMILADGMVAVSSAVLAVAFLLGTPSLVLVYIILFLRGIGSTFHSPAMQAAIPQLVPEEELTKAGGWSQLVSSASNMVGPILGAALMSIMPLAAVMLFDIVGAAFAIVTLFFVVIPTIPHSDEKLHVWADMKQAFKTIVANKPLITIAIPVLLAFMLYMPLTSLIPLLIVERFGGTEWHTSIIQFLFAGGFMVAGLVMGIWGGIKKQFLMISVSLIGLGAFIALAGFMPSSLFVVFAFCAFAIGCFGSFYIVPTMAYIQKSIPQDQMGKVLSLATCMLACATPIGLVAAGPVSALLGVNGWFMISGVALVAVGVLCCVLTKKFDKS